MVLSSSEATSKITTPVPTLTGHGELGFHLLLLLLLFYRDTEVLCEALQKPFSAAALQFLASFRWSAPVRPFGYECVVQCDFSEVLLAFQCPLCRLHMRKALNLVLLLCK